MAVSSSQFFSIFERRISFSFTLMVTTTLMSCFISHSYLYAAENDREEAMAAIQRVTNEVVPEKKTQAIEDLSDFKFGEVAEAVVEMARAEIQKPKPNSYYLTAMLDVVSEIGGPDEASKLMELSELANDQLPSKVNSATAQVLIKKIDAAYVQTMRNRRPPRLPAPETIRESLEQMASKDPEIRMFLNGSVGILNDEIVLGRANGSMSPIIGREAEEARVLDTLIRIKGKVPVLMGDAGVGKTSVVEGLAARSIDHNLPEGLYRSELENAIWVQTSASKIASMAKSDIATAQAAAVEGYLEGLRKARISLNRPIVLFIDEAHQLEKAQLNALKPHLESRDPLPVILVTTGKELGQTLRDDEAIMGRVEPILVEEFNEAKTFDAMKKSWVPRISKRYNVDIPDEALTWVIKTAPEYRPDIKRMRGPVALLQDVAIALHRANKGKKAVMTKDDVFSLVASRAGIPVVPQDRQAFLKYMDQLKSDLKGIVVGQDKMIDKVVDRFSSSLQSVGRRHSVVMIIGVTGSGKSMGAEELGKSFYNGKSRNLVIDMTQYSDGEFSANILFGAPNGIISSDTNKGIVNEYLDGPGKGGGIIILNEIEKASPGVLQRFMELFDRGEIRGGDGRVRTLGRHLIVMTSNKGARKLFPDASFRTMTRADLDRRLDRITEQDLKSNFVQPETYTKTGNTIGPEVAERVDSWILASPLLMEDAIEIARRSIVAYEKTLIEKGSQGEISIDPRLAEAFARAVFDPARGARVIDRKIVENLDRLLADFHRAYGVPKQTQIQLKLNNTDPTQFSLVATGPDGKSVSIQGPKMAPASMMRDPEFRKRLANLEPNIKKIVFGQDEAVESVSTLVLSSAANPDAPPPSLYLMGPTGTGKTEIGKATASSLYGRADAYLRVDMGKVQHEFDLNDVFSPPKGVIGSDQPGQLERFLESFPDGGVLIFDEMGNAGGSDKGLRQRIAQAFYPILDEGEWTSPSGKTFNLKKYVILFTGNDGQEIFQGLPSEEARTATWQQMSKDESTARKILIDRGLPEALVGRIKEVRIMRPASDSSKADISAKLLNEWAKKVSANQPFEVKFDPQFVQEIGSLFYSPDQGGRSVRNFIDSKLGDQVAKAMLSFNWDSVQTSRQEIQLSMEVKSPTKPFYESKKEETSAVLVVKSVLDGKVQYEKRLDVTARATFPQQVPESEAWYTAYHEAAHAVLNPPQTTGKKLAYLTIAPGSGYGGYARYEQDELLKKMTHDEDILVAEIALRLGGVEVEELLGRPRNTGGKQDIDQIRSLLQDLLVRGNLMPQLDGASVDKDGNLQLSSAQKNAVEKKSDEVIDKSRNLAKQLIQEKWAAIHRVASQLMERGKLTGEEFETLLKDPKNAATTISLEQEKARLTHLRKSCSELIESVVSK